MPDMGSLPGAAADLTSKAQAVCRVMSLPVTGQPVLGADLKRSERIPTPPSDRSYGPTRAGGGRVGNLGVSTPRRGGASISLRVVLRNTLK
jgi:hypothetical protein